MNPADVEIEVVADFTVGARGAARLASQSSSPDSLSRTVVCAADGFGFAFSSTHYSLGLPSEGGGFGHVGGFVTGHLNCNYSFEPHGQRLVRRSAAALPRRFAFCEADGNSRAASGPRPRRARRMIVWRANWGESWSLADKRIHPGAYMNAARDSITGAFQSGVLARRMGIAR